MALDTVATGLADPTYLTAPPGDPRLFVLEQVGRIRVIEDGALLPDAFLDITASVLATDDEQGLLGMAFDPDFAANGRFYVDYTGAGGSTRLESYTVTAGGDAADPASATLLLEVAQPESNHNGGQLAFGPDGMLYVGLGDGGGAGDPDGNAQDVSTLLGTILRLDVSDPAAYAVPADNPFVGDPGARGEIWHYGLRNPWRFSFDDALSLLVVGDVGQDDWEEIDTAPAGTGGLNFGWNITEGTACYDQAVCVRTGLTPPVAVYSHDVGCSVVGGYVYRGTAVPEIAGRYVYSDWCAGLIKSLALSSDGSASDPAGLGIERPGSVTSLGVDADGELYVVTGEGGIFKIVPAS